MKFDKDLDSLCFQASHNILLSRIVREMEILTAMSLNLQSGIHTLDLSESTNHTRRVLQSADKLSQTLMCLKIALESVSHSHQGKEKLNTHELLDRIFLEDVRDRLSNGVDSRSDQTNTASGIVDFF